MTNDNVVMPDDRTAMEIWDALVVSTDEEARLKAVRIAFDDYPELLKALERVDAETGSCIMTVSCDTWDDGNGRPDSLACSCCVARRALAHERNRLLEALG